MDQTTPSEPRTVAGLVRQEPIAAAFVPLYMVGFGVLAAVQGNREFIFYAVVMLALIGLVLAADRRVCFSWRSIRGLAIWGFLHMAGGTVPLGGGVLYAYRAHEMLPRYDQCVHVFGFGVATVVCWECIRAAVRPMGRLRASVGVSFGVALMGMGLGALNEVVEFTATLVLPETNVGGYQNNAWDLVCNTIGALVVAAEIWRRHHDD